MARSEDPNTQYRIKIHTNGGYTYASTQRSYTETDTGKKKYRHIHWGTVDKDFKFYPAPQYYMSSPEERAKLIFPEDWDMSLTKETSQADPNYVGIAQNRLYGDIWLLEQIAEITGIRRDLEIVFDGNNEIVDDIITLAMFPYITQYTYNRVARWQRIAAAPSIRELTPKAITLLTQSITEQHRMDLMRLRAGRLSNEELCVVDSTTRSAYGWTLADIRWGKNKENLPLEQTLEVVVYTLDSHMPVYYRTFPGNMPDSRSLGVILTDLNHAGFKDLIVITDRGYESLHNLEEYIERGQSIIMCVKTGQMDAFKVIDSLGTFSTRPEEMQIDRDSLIYYKQYDIEREIEDKKSDRLKLNLYFDTIRRGAELRDLDIELSYQEEELRKLLENKAILEDDSWIKREFSYFKVKYDKETRVIESFERNDTKISKLSKLSGFFAIMTHGIDFDAMEVFNTYRLRDEQEKYFQQMKDQMVSDRQRTWSEEGKTGRLFILFVSLILSSYVRYIWKSTRLHELLSTSLEILDEMRSIRLIEHHNHPRVITPFVGAQIDICTEFDIEIPEGCAPAYILQKKPERKRGRPPKKL